MLAIIYVIAVAAVANTLFNATDQYAVLVVVVKKVMTGMVMYPGYIMTVAMTPVQPVAVV